MCKGADDGELVGDGGGLFQQAAEVLACVRLDGPQFAANLDRGVGLGVERVDVAHASREKDLNDRVGRWRLGRSIVGLRAGTEAGAAQHQKVAERQAHPAEHADLQNLAPRRRTEVRGVGEPGAAGAWSVFSHAVSSGFVLDATNGTLESHLLRVTCFGIRLQCRI